MNRQVLSWASYDLANTAFSALFVTFFFPFFVKEFLGGSEFQIGLVFGGSMLLVGVFVPLIGAWSDVAGRRVPFIAVFTLACCFSLVAVGFVPLSLALVIGGVANFFYHAALTTYNALLPQVSSSINHGFVSGIGIGAGYLGTLVSLGAASALLFWFGWESMAGIQAVFVLTAVIFFGFSCILFVFFKEKPVVHHDDAFRLAVLQVRKTLGELRRHASLFWFMITMLFFGDGMNAVILFLFLYARSVIGLEVQSFMVVYAVFSAAAMAGSLLAGRFSDRYGAKCVLGVAGGLWLVVVGVLLVAKSLLAFVLVGVVGGVALGTVWTAMRPVVLQLTPRHREGQFFGYLELTDKFSGVLGPVVFGYLAAHVSYTAALVSLLGFFGAGLLALRRV